MGSNLTLSIPAVWIPPDANLFTNNCDVSGIIFVMVSISVPILIVSLTSKPEISVTFIFVETPVTPTFGKLDVNPTTFWFTTIVFVPSSWDNENVDIPEIITLSLDTKLCTVEAIPTILLPLVANTTSLKVDTPTIKFDIVFPNTLSISAPAPTPSFSFLKIIASFIR